VALGVYILKIRVKQSEAERRGKIPRLNLYKEGIGGV